MLSTTTRPIFKFVLLNIAIVIVSAQSRAFDFWQCESDLTLLNLSAQQTDLLISETTTGSTLKLSWNSIRKTLRVVSLVGLALVAIERPKLVLAPTDLLTFNSHKFDVSQDKILKDEKNFRDGLFNSWKEGFYQSHNRYPDPIQDKVEWEQKMNEVYNSPIEDFRVRDGR